jgi:hypothetical protein
MKFDKLAVGMVLFDLHSYRMGNTTMRSLGVWPVRVVEIDAEKRRALCNWNGNAPTWYSEWNIEKLKGKKPILISTGMGGQRRPTREELAEIRAKAKAEK